MYTTTLFPKTILGRQGLSILQVVAVSEYFVILCLCSISHFHDIFQVPSSPWSASRFRAEVVSHALTPHALDFSHLTFCRAHIGLKLCGYLLQTLCSLDIQRIRSVRVLSYQPALDQHGSQQEVVFCILTGRNFDFVAQGGEDCDFQLIDTFQREFHTIRTRLAKVSIPHW